MEAFLISTALVSLAEIGDKTQLLAFLLAARFKKPIPIIWGIFVATLLNHALASWLGTWVTQQIDPSVLRWILGFSFLGMAIWILVPDKVDEQASLSTQKSIFLTTLVAFFLAEMGDKTQIATVAMSAKFQAMWWVTAGTTLGMLIANVPAVLVGDKLATKISMKWVRGLTSGIFGILGIWILFHLDHFFV